MISSKKGREIQGTSQSRKYVKNFGSDGTESLLQISNHVQNGVQEKNCTYELHTLHTRGDGHALHTLSVEAIIRGSSAPLFLRVQVRDGGLMLPLARASSRRGYDHDDPMVMAPFQRSKLEAFPRQPEIKRSCQWVYRHRSRPSRPSLGVMVKWVAAPSGPEKLDDGEPRRSGETTTITHLLRPPNELGHDKNNIMMSRIPVDDTEISRSLHNTSDGEIQESDSETEDDLLEDEVHSDAEDYEVSAPPEVNALDTEDVSENDFETPESALPSMSSNIVMAQRKILRCKNDHRWTATKGRTNGRVSSTKVIRTPEGPTRMNKYLYEPLECFSIFITNDIVEEITKWTNAEIQLKAQKPDVKTTFKTTSCEEI
ncbi:hypothetical protein EVAR_99555_1 [Eumeta japonica]|uniref:PiggyBac transposable element-derived protein domain-containing protein n=1 Tax=Eumeta variegata TaxID=151549 RepID=A0A4C1YWM0_EUMVA|nr:hypothetical protein EVAR_99555_1 [Eumeta japonica]